MEYMENNFSVTHDNAPSDQKRLACWYINQCKYNYRVINLSNKCCKQLFDTNRTIFHSCYNKKTKLVLPKYEKICEIIKFMD